MSIQLQPSVPLVTLVKTESPKVIKNEPPEEALEKEISPDIKDIDIVYHSLSEDLIKSETVPENILETKYSESVETQVLVKTEDTSDENVTRGTGQEVIEVQASNEHSNALSKLKTDEQFVLNFFKDLNSINVRSRKSKSPRKIDFAECYKTDETSLRENEKEKIKNIKAPVIPIKAHEYTFLAENKHVCNHCQYACNTLSHLKRHIEKIHKEVTTMYQCPYCPYKSKRSVKKHIIQKHKNTKDIQWFQCNFCEIKFKLKGNLTQHMKIHLKHKQMKDGLDLHEKGHARNTDFTQCYKIDRTISREKEKIEVIRAPTIPVEAHEYTSLSKDRHVCNHCQYEYKGLRNLKFHIRKMHREVTTMYQCPYCLFKSKWSPRLHIIQKHKDIKDIQWFQCNLCEIKFKLKSSLTQHMKIHLKYKQMQDGFDICEKRYHCNNCDYKTDDHHILKRHNLVHLKPEEIEYFYCYHCSYKCKQKSNLKIHIFRQHFKNVKQGKRFGCNKCDYKTYTSTDLKKHKLIHLKPEEVQYFCCYHCSYKAKRKGNLKEHIFIHFKKEQIKFDCYICNFITQKRESIIAHIKKHSKVQNKSEINEGS